MALSKGKIICADTNLTLQFVYELLQLIDLGAPVVVWLHADP